jgi:hypothetical protein
MSNIKIDSAQMPNRVGMGRISLNQDIGKQSQGSTFGEKVSAGLQNGASAVASGASMLGSTLPGASLISAAVSNVGRMTGGSASASAGYAVTGVVNNGTGLGTSNVNANGTSTLSTGGASTSAVNLQSGSSNNQVGTMNTSLSEMSDQNTQMLQVQIAMQRENQMFTSVSNVLKTKHDTVKNSISNVH